MYVCIGAICFICTVLEWFIPFKTYHRMKKQMPLAIFLLVFRRFALLVFKNILFHPYKLRTLNMPFRSQWHLAKWSKHISENNGIPYIHRGKFSSEARTILKALKRRIYMSISNPVCLSNSLISNLLAIKPIENMYFVMYTSFKQTPLTNKKVDSF